MYKWSIHGISLSMSMELTKFVCFLLFCVFFLHKRDLGVVSQSVLELINKRLDKTGKLFLNVIVNYCIFFAVLAVNACITYWTDVVLYKTKQFISATYMSFLCFNWEHQAANFYMPEIKHSTLFVQHQLDDIPFAEPFYLGGN